MFPFQIIKIWLADRCASELTLMIRACPFLSNGIRLSVSRKCPEVIHRKGHLKTILGKLPFPGKHSLHY